MTAQTIHTTETVETQTSAPHPVARAARIILALGILAVLAGAISGIAPAIMIGIITSVGAAFLLSCLDLGARRG